MNTEDQRIEIAKSCGWKNINLREFLPGAIPIGTPPNCDGVLKPLPDYLNDLNAMHEAEKMLKGEERNFYYWTLGTLCARGVPPRDQRIKFITATASQRAEAFLFVIKKWVDGKDDLKEAVSFWNVSPTFAS